MPSAPRSTSSRIILGVTIALLVPTVLLTIAMGAWALDTGDTEGEAQRNVEVGGVPVGGLDPAALEVALATLGREYPASTVEVDTPGGLLTASGTELGLVLDVERTRADVLAVGRDGTAVERFSSWVGAFFGPRASRVAVSVDPALVQQVVVSRDPTGRTAPVEPGIAAREGELVVVPGVPGTGLDPATVAERIVGAGADGELPITVDAEPAPVRPRFDDEAAGRLADQGRELTSAPLVVQAGDTGAEVPPATMRTWLSSTPAAAGLELVTDANKAFGDLTALLDDVGAPPVNATFTVEGDRVVVIAGSRGTTCCAPDAGAQAVAAVLDRPDGPLVLPLTPLDPDRTSADAEALGIREPVGSFTTSFPAGQSRVNNIYRIADLTRGVVIEPGGSFSVNGLIGRRTEANGFTTGGVIQDGVFEESVGGGISQFATTLFNAAFFGGLEYGAYQSHSIFITRYPYGREATLSFPAPDLVIENPSPHGVLIWPTYTPSSITVTLYSTPWARGEQTDQTMAPAGACTRVTTERTRTFVADGRVEKDAVFATYRPEEGVDC